MLKRTTLAKQHLINNKHLSWLVIGFSVFIGVLVFEVLCGDWFLNDPWRIAKTINVNRNVNTNIWVKNLGFQNDISSYARDQYGLRGTCKEKNLADMVTIGGSTTEQKYISEGKTWQDLLQEKINRGKSESPFCIANAGIDGHSTFGHLASFDIWFPRIPNFRPQYFLFYVGINDASFRFKEIPDFDRIAETTSSLKSKIKEKSVVFRIYKALNKRDIPRDTSLFAWHQYVDKRPELYSENNLSPDTLVLAKENAQAFRLRMKKILDKVHEANGIPICVTQPHTLAWHFGERYVGVKNAFSHSGREYNGLDYDFSIGLINKELQELCKQYNGFYVDLYQKKFELSDFYDFVHTTPQGSQKIADYLFEEIVSQKIIPPRAEPTTTIHPNHS